MILTALIYKPQWSRKYTSCGCYGRRQAIRAYCPNIYIMRIRPSIRHACSFMRELETVFSATFKKKSLAALSLLTIWILEFAIVWNFYVNSLFLGCLLNGPFKGQLNSEQIYEVIVSPKMQTKNYKDFCPTKQKRIVALFWWFFGECRQFFWLRFLFVW